MFVKGSTAMEVVRKEMPSFLWRRPQLWSRWSRSLATFSGDGVTFSLVLVLLRGRRGRTVAEGFSGWATVIFSFGTTSVW